MQQGFKRKIAIILKSCFADYSHNDGRHQHKIRQGVS